MESQVCSSGYLALILQAADSELVSNDIHLRVTIIPTSQVRSNRGVLPSSTTGFQTSPGRSTRCFRVPKRARRRGRATTLRATTSTSISTAKMILMTAGGTLKMAWQTIAELEAFSSTAISTRKSPVWFTYQVTDRNKIVIG